jgi:hypothetical protein
MPPTVHKNLLQREAHIPGNLFSSPFQAVDGIVLQSRENGVEGREIVQNSTFLEK